MRDAPPPLCVAAAPAGDTGALFMTAMGAGGFLGRTTGRSRPHAALKSRPPNATSHRVSGDESAKQTEIKRPSGDYFGNAPDTQCTRPGKVWREVKFPVQPKRIYVIISTTGMTICK